MTDLINQLLIKLEHVYIYFSRVFLTLAFFLSIAYYLGWMHRFIWFMMEREACKILNGTPVTLGGYRMDLLHGRFWFDNVVVHAPKRADWKWHSPVLARVGKAYVECNALRVLLSITFLRREPPIDAYTVYVKDIQAFIERKYQVYNFFLLDPHNILPNPHDFEDIVSTTKSPSSNSSRQQHDSDNNNNNETVNDEVEEDPETSDMAQKVVTDMVRAMHSIGRAAQRRGSWQGVFAEHKHHLTDKLKALQDTKKGPALQEGVKLVQEVSKNFVEKTQGVQKVVLPQRRSLPNDKVVYARLGRFVLEDCYIFVRDSFDNTWQEPIFLERVSLKSAECSPPLSALDENGWPILYQPLDRTLDLLWKRIVAAMAKANTGRLLHTAVGEVLDLWLEKDRADPS